MKNKSVALTIVLSLGLMSGCVATKAKYSDDQICSAEAIENAFSGKIVTFEKWSSSKANAFTIDIGDDGYALVNGVKLGWSADRTGKFCIGMEEKAAGKKAAWGCKKIYCLKNGSFYAVGRSEKSSGAVSIQ